MLKPAMSKRSLKLTVPIAAILATLLVTSAQGVSAQENRPGRIHTFRENRQERRQDWREARRDRRQDWREARRDRRQDFWEAHRLQ